MLAGGAGGTCFEVLELLRAGDEYAKGAARALAVLRIFLNLERQSGKADDMFLQCSDARQVLYFHKALRDRVKPRA